MLSPVFLLSSAFATTHIFITNAFTTAPRCSRLIPTGVSMFESTGNKDNNINNDEENVENNKKWDDNIDYDKEWSTDNTIGGGGGDDDDDGGGGGGGIPDLSDISFGDTTDLLGIDLSLEPLSEIESEQLRLDARKIIEDAIDTGVNDIEALKKKMKRDLEVSRQAINLASDLEAIRESDLLMNKIDKLTQDFLKSSERSRTSTKLAAAASRAMEGTTKAKGLEVGTWGVLRGSAVLADDDIITDGNGLLGSVRNAIQKTTTTAMTTTDESKNTVQENRILIIADTKQDKLAKRLVPALLKEFDHEDTKIPGLIIDILSPTANIPLGAKDAACVIIFCTSLDQSDTLKKILDRLLRKTLATGGGKVGKPPTQLVGISTLGTERFESFPYSVQNFLGGKLEKRRSIEEVLMNTIRDRVTEPSLDYTIIKLKEGDFISAVEDSADFSLLPGDISNDATSIETAVNVIVQATAFQPSARNSTLSISGALPPSFFLETDSLSSYQFEELQEDFWRETFTCLDGPELWRSIVYDSLEKVGPTSERTDIADYYDGLVEYIQGWGSLLADSGKDLTTPIRADVTGVLDPSSMITPDTSRTILYQEGVRLLFLPSNTGARYMSRKEENDQEKDRQANGNESTTSPATTAIATRRISRDGGIDVLVEIVKNVSDRIGADGKIQGQQLRVRARRTNYAADAVIKELSETTIVKRLQDAVEVWKKNQNVL